MIYRTNHLTLARHERAYRRVRTASLANELSQNKRLHLTMRHVATRAARLEHGKDAETAISTCDGAENRAKKLNGIGAIVVVAVFYTRTRARRNIVWSGVALKTKE